jgi:hypothetical protein
VLSWSATLPAKTAHENGAPYSYGHRRYSGVSDICARKAGARKEDARVRYVDYDPANVVDLWTTPGAILTIEFADDETIAGVAVSDSHVLRSDKRKNF